MPLVKAMAMFVPIIAHRRGGQPDLGRVHLSPRSRKIACTHCTTSATIAGDGSQSANAHNALRLMQARRGFVADHS